MQIHSLDLEDFSEDKYSLICIHSALDGYKLAYLLNQKLGTSFVRSEESLDFKNKKNNASFPVYEYKSSAFSSDWFLIANQFTNDMKEASDGLFRSNEVTMYLIPEKKKVDYFLKLIGDFDFDGIVKIINQINTMNQVITSYTINPNILKSKEFLIF